MYQNLSGESVTYSVLYNSIGKWFAKNYGGLNRYVIEVTNLLTSKGKIVSGVQFKDPKEMGYSLLGNTLAHIATYEFLERPYPYDKGVRELDVSNLDRIMQGYDLMRAPDQNLYSDYHQVKVTTINPITGHPRIIIDFVPVEENPKIAEYRINTVKGQRLLAKSKGKGKK